jgi:hypothetical protein
MGYMIQFYHEGAYQLLLLAQDITSAMKERPSLNNFSLHIRTVLSKSSVARRTLKTGNKVRFWNFIARHLHKMNV